MAVGAGLVVEVDEEEDSDAGMVCTKVNMTGTSDFKL